MADPSSRRTALTDEAKPSDVDVEKGIQELNSDLEATTITLDTDSEPTSRDGTAGEKGNAESKDPNIVSWDGPDDPTNPMNWTMRKKWSNVAVLSILTIIT